jgi:hypothetical protein
MMSSMSHGNRKYNNPSNKASAFKALYVNTVCVNCMRDHRASNVVLGGNNAGECKYCHLCKEKDCTCSSAAKVKLQRALAALPKSDILAMLPLNTTVSNVAGTEASDKKRKIFVVDHMCYKTQLLLSNAEIAGKLSAGNFMILNTNITEDMQEEPAGIMQAALLKAYNAYAAAAKPIDKITTERALATFEEWRSIKRVGKDVTGSKK